MNPPKVISLYTGAGGLDLGLEAAGFETAVAVEHNGPACATLRANRDWPVIEADIHSPAASSPAILAAAGLGVGEADLLVGGPPCQPFSKTAYWASGGTRGLSDPRADTLTAYLRVLRDTLPRGFVLENVRGITNKNKDEALALLRETVEAINAETGATYSFEWRVLNAADYGVPQTRERFILVGARDGTAFEFPEPTHHDPDAAGGPPDLFAGPPPTAPWTTAWDAIGDLEPPKDPQPVTGKWGDLLPSIPEGENYLHHTPRGGGLPLFGWRTRYWFFLLKLSKLRPSWTITAQPGSAVGPFHWTNRKLTTEELARIQTFPDGYEIVGGQVEGRRQLGNAVPSLLGEVLGREVRRQFLGDATYLGPLTLLPARETPPTPPEPVLPVEEKYHAFIADHEDHPGTGKGPASVKRAA